MGLTSQMNPAGNAEGAFTPVPGSFAQVVDVRGRLKPLAQVQQRKTTVSMPWWKTTIDIALSLLGLTLLSPLLVVVAALVKLTSKGPIFFTQERIGLNRRVSERRQNSSNVPRDCDRKRERRVLYNCGKPFKMYKIRTMVVDAEQGQPKWASKKDARITPLGLVLRKTRIDEIPQLINVLKGDMSIVGPRPERAYFISEIEKEVPEFRKRLRSRPGITGLAQVELGYTNNVEGQRKKLNFDLDYIRNLTIAADLRILFKTLFVVFTGKGAY
jgi:lipopolysaccharide/colanic/teichoic acid biosynthesis glycosyltransferase